MVGRGGAPAAAGKADASVAESAPHVLVLNDERDLLALFRAVLEDAGYRVTTLTYPVADLGDVHRLAPDAMVLDLLIGGEDLGWQFLQQLRLDRTAAAIPVLVCSAAVRMVDAVQPRLQAMGIEVLLKPFDIDDLLREVAAMVGRPDLAG